MTGRVSLLAGEAVVLVPSSTGWPSNLRPTETGYARVQLKQNTSISRAENLNPCFAWWCVMLELDYSIVSKRCFLQLVKVNIKSINNWDVTVKITVRKFQKIKHLSLNLLRNLGFLTKKVVFIFIVMLSWYFYIQMYISFFITCDDIIHIFRPNP